MACSLVFPWPCLTALARSFHLAGLLNRCRWQLRAWPYAHDDVACLRTPPAFVDAAAELLAPLLGRMPVAVLPTGAATDAGALAGALAAARVTRLIAVPMLLAALVQHLEAGEVSACCRPGPEPSCCSTCQAD